MIEPTQHKARYTRPDANGFPDIERWNALCARCERRARHKGWYPWLFYRYRELPLYVHRRIWIGSWWVLALAVGGWLFVI